MQRRVAQRVRHNASPPLCTQNNQRINSMKIYILEIRTSNALGNEFTEVFVYKTREAAEKKGEELAKEYNPHCFSYGVYSATLHDE